jgi:hypothetical protein
VARPLTTSNKHCAAAIGRTASIKLVLICHLLRIAAGAARVRSSPLRNPVSSCGAGRQITD